MKPIKTKPFFCEKDWGGTSLRELFGKAIPSDKTGESWEISAHPNGESMLDDIPLSRAIEIYGKELMGEVQSPFPLLIKLLDARENLSVQIHPDDILADKLEGQPFGKAEAWYVLSAPENAYIVLGTNCSGEELVSAIEQGKMEDSLTKLPVHEGDTIFIPAGTVHALMSDILVYEVQQSSDTTYRLYAWGRDAELHIDKSIKAMELPALGAGMVKPRTLDSHTQRLIDSSFFTLDRVTPGDKLELEANGRVFKCYTALEAGCMTFDGGKIEYIAGDSILVPASAGKYTLSGGTLLCAKPVID